MKYRAGYTLSAMLWALTALAAFAVSVRAQDGASYKLLAAKKDSATPHPSGAQLPVIGNGTSGQITKWLGTNGSNFIIGDSVITEDKNGKVGIGTTTPTSQLTVKGIIETTLGGVRFPDGTLQTTAFQPDQVVKSINGLHGDLTLAGGPNIFINTSGGNTLTVTAPDMLTAVAHNATLAGKGTAATPLGIANGGVNTTQLADSSVTAVKIAPASVVKSLNGLTDNVTLAAGSNITLTTVGNKVTISSAASGDTAQNAFQIQQNFLVQSGSAGLGGGIISVPSGKRFVIEYVSVSCNHFVDKELGQLELQTTVAGATATHMVEMPPGHITKNGGVAAGKMVRIYSDGNVTFDFDFQDNISLDVFVSITLSGYLIDLP